MRWSRAATGSLPATIVVVFLCCLVRSADAQQVDIRGRVTTDGQLPVPGAAVSALASDGRIVVARTDGAGVYRLALAAGDSVYLLTTSALGFRPQSRVVRLAAGESPALVSDFRLTRAAVPLDTVHTIGRRPRPLRDEPGITPAPGQLRQALDVSSEISGELTGSVSAALAMVPGIISTPGTAGTASVAAFGLRPEHNGNTLNGSDVGAGFSLPRDGLRRQVRMATYDPRFGRYNGVQIATSLLCACVDPSVLLHATVDNGALRWSRADQTAGALGTDAGTYVLSGVASGALAEERTFLNMVYQLERHTMEAAPLFALAPASLALLGINPDSLARLRDVAGVLNLPVGSVRPTQARTTSGSIATRLDFTNAPRQMQVLETLGSTVYLLASGSWSHSSGLGVGPLASSATATTASRSDGQVMFAYAPYLFDVLTETRVSVAASRQSAGVESALPSATILSIARGASGGVNALSLGGAGGPRQSDRTATFQLSNETSWMSRDGRHKYQVYGDLSMVYASAFQDAIPNGAFSFVSVEDLAQAHPASFLRTVGGTLAPVSATQAALGISDIFRSRDDGALTSVSRGEGLTVQYGARLEAERYHAVASTNPLVLTFLGRRTGVMPSSVSMSPMVGLSWVRGRYREDAVDGGWYSSERHLVTGGIREYRGTLSPLTVSRLSQQNGLSGSASLLDCAGAAAPVPDWSAYDSNPASIPIACASGATPSLGRPSVPIALFSPTFNAPRSWRAEFTWRMRASGKLYVTVGSSYSLNLGGIERFDLNFDGRQQLALVEEARRPVFVGANSIDASSGVVSAVDARRVAALATVADLRSDLRAEQRQFVLGAEYQLRRTVATSAANSDRAQLSGTIRATYTNAVGRSQTSGFAGSTAADPREIAWNPDALPHHTVQALFTGSLDRWFSFSLSARLSSGIRFTPHVAGDINGDGLANDRAFVFDPAGSNPASDAMRALLANARPRVRECLQPQVGHIAAVNSCIGPWSISPGVLSITLDPYRIGLGNRGTLTLQVINVAGGIDQVFHGGSGLRGWGQPAFPDAALLTPIGFEPAANRFRYAVNPQFGSAAPRQLSYRDPVRLTIDFHAELGTDQETRAIESLMRDAFTYDVSASETTLAAYLIATARPRMSADIWQILRMRDTLALGQDQVARLESAQKRIREASDSVYVDLAHYLFRQRGHFGDAGVRSAWHDAIATVIRRTHALLMESRDALSIGQLEWLASHHLAAGMFHSRDWLDRVTRGPLTYPR